MIGKKQIDIDEQSLRRTGYGDVYGFSDIDDSHAWLGIPYAKPPIGALRWCAPRPPESWAEPYHALRFGERCMQRYLGAFGGGRKYIGSEDCLYLNLWSPKFKPDAIPTGNLRLPTMVWVHGGGNVFGGGDSYIGSKLATSQQVIVVTLNYRLGPLGWFSHAALHDDSSTAEDRSGNYGTLDIILALEWIRGNISAFGGDPERVTIFGSSGGAWNVRSLLASPKAKGLFHRAAIHSNAMELSDIDDARNFIDDENPGHPQSSGELVLQLLIQKGMADDRSSAKAKLSGLAAGEISSLLRSRTLEELETAYLEIADRTANSYLSKEKENTIKISSTSSMFSVPKVFSDGLVLSKGKFHEIFLSGSYNRVPVILGSNRDEDKCFLSLDRKFVVVSSDGSTKIKNPQRYEFAARYLSSLWKAMAVDEPAVAMTENEPRSVFAYRIDWDEQPTINGTDFGVLRGADHSIGDGFIFGGEDHLIGPEFEEASNLNMITQENMQGYEYLSGAMMSYWAEFAYSGKPGRGRDSCLPEWKPWQVNSQESDKMLVLDTPADGGIRMSSESADRAAVLEQIKSNPCLKEVDRCQLYRDMLEYFITRLTLSEYENLEDGLCGKYSAAIDAEAS